VGRTTNKQRRAQTAASAREKAAQRRQEEQRRAQRRRAISILSSVVAVALVIVLVAILAITHKSSTKSDSSRPPVPAAVMKDLTSVSPATLAKVGVGTASYAPKKVTDKPLTAGGKPELLFIGGEFCPICAAQRWPLIVALSKFGTFSGVKYMHSAVDDGNYPTFTFYKSTYSSPYLTFVSREVEDRNSQPLENPTSAENALWEKYTSKSAPTFPFIDYGGKVVATSASFDGSVLGTQTQAQIAAQLNDPSKPVSKAIDGSANLVTAAVCTMTGNKPASICLTPSITQAQSQIGG